MNWEACYKTGLGDSFSGVAPLSCLPPLVANLTYWAFVFAGVIAVFFIIYAGFQYVRSGGDAKLVQSARATLTYAVIGLIVVLSSVFILNVISRVTGIGCLRSFGMTSCSNAKSPTHAGDYYCSTDGTCTKSTTGTDAPVGTQWFNDRDSCKIGCGTK